MKILLPNTCDNQEKKVLLPIDEEALAALASRQVVIRPDHARLAEFPIDPSRPDIRIEGSVLAFNPEVKHDEAVGVKLVTVGADQSRTAVALQQGKGGVSAELREGEHVGLYLFTPSRNTATMQRFEDLCLDGGSIVKVQGTRNRSLVCAIRLGQEPLYTDANGELPVPMFAQEQGFPRSYLQTSKRQTLGILEPGPNGYERKVKMHSDSLVFGQNIPMGSELTIAVLERIEHTDLRTMPIDMRRDITRVFSGDVLLRSENEDRPAISIHELQQPRQRLVTGMRIRLNQAEQLPEEFVTE